MLDLFFCGQQCLSSHCVLVLCWSAVSQSIVWPQHYLLPPVMQYIGHASDLMSCMYSNNIMCHRVSELK